MGLLGYSQASTGAGAKDEEQPSETAGALSEADAKREEAKQLYYANRRKWQLSVVPVLLVATLAGVAWWTSAASRPAARRSASAKYTMRASSTGCSNWWDIKIGNQTYEWEPFECAERCQKTIGCVGFGFQQNSCEDRTMGTKRAGNCMMWKGVCDDKPNSCWNDYKMLDTHRHMYKMRESGQGKGCRNWEYILLDARNFVYKEDCGDFCLKTDGCTGFGYQTMDCTDKRLCNSRGSCYLWKGQCDVVRNLAWDDYVVSTIPKTQAPTAAPPPPAPTSAPQRLAADVAAGATTLTLADETAYGIGDTITIADATNSQTVMVTGKGTLVISEAIKYSFSKDSTLVGIASKAPDTAAPTAAPTSAPTSAPTAAGKHQTVKLSTIEIEGLDLDKLRENSTLYSTLHDEIQRDVAKKLGVHPNQVNLSLE